MVNIKDNVKNVREQIAAAAKKSGREESDILLVAVTKTRSAEEIVEAIKCGVVYLGENKVQEITAKFEPVVELLGDASVLPDVKWHMIGHLQSNKVKYIIDKVDMIESIDSIKLAVEVDRRAKSIGRTVDVLIQVNAAEEESKFGITIDETIPLIERVLDSCENISIKGLMSIAPIAEDPNDIRQYFSQVKVLFDKIATDMSAKNLEMKFLSMGMTHDFETAIEEGSNLVRIGTGIFGERTYS